MPPTSAPSWPGSAPPSRWRPSASSWRSSTSFLKATSQTLGGRGPSALGERVADVAGLLVIALAGLMMVLATVRFRRTSFAIDSPDKRSATGVRMDIALVALLMLFGAALFAYMSYSVADHLT